MTPLNLDGLTPVPATHVAAIVTSLEMRARPALPEPEPPPLPLDAIGADIARYRALFDRVGAPWLWFSRRRIDDAALAAILADPAVEALALTEGGRDIGLLELDARVPGEVEIAFFGLAPEAIGQGAGRRLMTEALRRAWSRPVRRVWVHTCTFDHPGAVAFYERSGFCAFARAIEVVPDPRLSGHLPRDAAPHVPVLA
ncbi:GNAT family N-acetyltransferase [Methylobacterium nodulans]|uniref:GCN5-related N-acetyltransferase n=1 Tax=Methylobacterium nodulans (strain LMG 21967 / CNCM I-2342 / ORS 2060) TaxID=460265 RepID=B8IQ28_METNO|nr:GNAT family N-acetyltransferase [Methylobacterium nodulans]ACL58528.1 GCN5-related N-acetyltransferase [Methylobacterium nodulans ORS 2060]